MAHVHIRPTIGSYAVDDPTKIIKGWKPFSNGETAAFGLYFSNSSDTSSAELVREVGKLLIVSKRPDLDTEFSTLETSASRWEGEELAPQDQKFFSVRSDALSSDQAEGVAAGTDGVFLVVVIKFSDSTGNYEQRVCDWLQTHTLDVWHGCGPKYESGNKD